MPILKNAKKALRVSVRKTAIRQPAKSRVKTMLDAVKKEPTAATAAKAFSAIDRAAKINIFHKKKAAHLKSQIARLLSQAPVTEVKVAKITTTAKPKVTAKTKVAAKKTVAAK